MLLIPYRADVPMERPPVANIILVVVTSLISLCLWSSPLHQSGWVLLGDSAFGWFGHMFCHGSWVHLIGNMLFLFVFGNAICAKVGNLGYVPVYLGLGLSAAIAHAVFDGDPAIGASGAVNGMVGFFLVLYPLNAISCFFLVHLRGGVFSVSAVWIVLLWFLFDVWGAAAGSGGVAYWAHIGGFLAGVASGVVCLLTGWLPVGRGEKTLLEVLGVMPEPARPAVRRRRPCRSTG